MMSTFTLSLSEPAGHGLSQKARRNRAALRLPDHQFDGRDVDRRGGTDPLRAAGDAPPDRCPGGAQNFLEWLFEGLYDLLESIIGRHLVERTFWFFATVFIFILAANWFGLLPGVGTIGWGHRHAPTASTSMRPLFRGANADLNMTLAMALVFFACWIVWALQEVGVRGVAHGPVRAEGRDSGCAEGADGRGVLRGRTAGDRLDPLPARLAQLPTLRQHLRRREHARNDGDASCPASAGCSPIPFYFMELLVGLVQALVFMLLTAVFTLLICQHQKPARRQRTADAARARRATAREKGRFR